MNRYFEVIKRNAETALEELKHAPRARTWDEASVHAIKSINAERALQVVEIVSSLTDEEITLLTSLKHPIYDCINLRPAKSIKQKYNLSLRELKNIIYYI